MKVLRLWKKCNKVVTFLGDFVLAWNVRFVFVSDTHGLQDRFQVPSGDVLCHTGDLTAHGRLDELKQVADWLRNLPHAHKVLIAGNHDFCLQNSPQEARALLHDLTYLEDEACEIEGILLYGSPWQPWFYDWAFNLPRGPALQQVWEKIPFSTQVLLTHGPPYGYLDRTSRGEAAGCKDLLQRVREVGPELHVFGHIHEAYGTDLAGPTRLVNASICDLEYVPKNAPWVFDWRDGSFHLVCA